MRLGLYEQLAQNFPEEQTVFGTCLLIPHNAFKPEWESQLKAEGVKVFQQSYNGRMFFFLKKADGNQSQTVKVEPAPLNSKLQPELKPFKWTAENLEFVRRLRAQGLSFRAIERKLRDLGFKAHHITIARKLKAESKPKPNVENIPNDDGLFQEYLESAMQLYPRYKRASAVLLKEAARILENG
ncbi:MAG: hypothetical protein QW660_04095 [Candidatus Bathyarchaeia archaeon]